MGVRASKLSKFVGVSRLKSLKDHPPPPPPPILTPKGYIPVSVGKDNNETKRFMVHFRALGDADFLELLCRSAEEYGFYNEGVLRIPYETEAFEDRMIRGAKQKYFKGTLAN